jgi:mono/diheme cytochrome c family protein
VLVALDADNGDEMWRSDVGAHVTGPVTWANDVLYVADDSGRIAAYDTAGGERLWSHEVAFPAAGGIAVVDATVYAGWGWWLAGAPEDPDGGLIAFRLGGRDGGDGGTAGGGGGTAGEADRGEEVYARSCASCHGGTGGGGSGPSLEGVDERLTRDEHLEVVRGGRGAMPAWEDDLTAEEIEAVVDYQRTVLAEGDG